MILRNMLILCLAASLSGCFLFPKKPTVQQGIIISPMQIQKLHLGMDQMQVIELIGSPLLSDMFHSNERWTYVYTFQRHGQPLEKQKLIVEFNQNRVVRISQ